MANADAALKAAKKAENEAKASSQVIADNAAKVAYSNIAKNALLEANKAAEASEKAVNEAVGLVENAKTAATEAKAAAEEVLQSAQNNAKFKAKIIEVEPLTGSIIVKFHDDMKMNAKNRKRKNKFS